MTLIDGMAEPTPIGRAPSSAARSRPPARPDRWQPSRAGLISLWRYWDETFEFHDGRLLLRGPNGSGKSMALELLLPFLIDGDTSPHKLSSAAKTRGTMFSRVMSGTTESNRSGFAWIEFRRDEDTFTVGARIRASQSTGRTERQLFTSTLRVGEELQLLDERRGAISRRDLIDAVGTTGRVTESASEHRQAVRRVLFPTFSADRYESLIGALVSLRREKLSQHLDLPKLSDVLSEALPPLDDHDIAEVAEGFERLDRRRHDIDVLEADLGQITSLAQRQRRYARSVVASAAGDVVSAESERDSVVRARRLAGEELADLDAQLGALVAEDDALRLRIADIDDEHEGIRDSALYQEGAQLDELRHGLGKRRRDLQDQTGSVERLAAARQDADGERARSAGQVATAGENLTRVWAELAQLGDRVGARSVLPPEDGTADGSNVGEYRSLLGAWVADRHRAVEAVRRLLAEHEQAVRDRGGAEDRLDTARQRSEGRAEECDAASAAVAEAVDAYDAAVSTWVADPIFTDAERQAIHAARQDEEPADLVEAAVAARRGERREAAAVARSDLATRHQVVTEERAGLAEDRALLETGSLPAPDAPRWRRRPAARSGAPLWRLVDVVKGGAEPVVDAVESALVAAGLADAWVSPDGDVSLGADDADLVLTASANPSSDGYGTLAEVFAPAFAVHGDEPVPAAVVAGVLRSIRLVDDATRLASGEVAIGRDATFRLGSAVGRGPGSKATLFGATARERHRLAEIERLSGEIATRDRELAEIDRRDQALVADLEAFEAVIAVRPERGLVDDARATLRDIEVRLAEATRRSEEARTELAEIEGTVRSTQRSLATECSRTGLPPRSTDLDEYRGELGRFDEQAEIWQRRSSELATAGVVLEGAQRSLQRANDAHGDAAKQLVRVESDVRSLGTRVSAIESALGRDYDELLARLDALRSEHTSSTDRQETLRRDRPPLHERRGELRQRVDDAEVRLGQAEVQRSRTQSRLTELAAGALLSDAGVSDEVAELDGATAVLAAARTLAAAVANDPADQLARRSRAVEELLHTVRASIAGRIDLVREQPGEADWLVLTGSAGGIRRPLADLRARLASDLAAARSELAAEEAELFERTLAGSIRMSLADRIRAANALVETINAQLDEVRTAAGVGVRLRWYVDDDQPPAVRAARSLLLRDPADLSDEERASLQDFVRARVDDARRDVELHSPWESRLRESLDYRGWHRFGLQVSHRDWQGFKPATGALLQRLSTGERSVALHLPMLASIAAHYADGQGGHLDGPRLILLDELFAGVDQTNRAQLFGTFSAWDLDAVFTSDHEWCQYATLDGIAIHHLHGGRNDEPVTSVRFVWDGAERTLDDRVS